MEAKITKPAFYHIRFYRIISIPDIAFFPFSGRADHDVSSPVWMFSRGILDVLNFDHHRLSKLLYRYTLPSIKR